MPVPVFALLCRTNEESNGIKTFDTFESQVTVFGNIFETKIILMNNVYLFGIFYIVAKMWFL